MPPAQKNPWRALAIIPGAVCCAAVQRLGRQRFLLRDAPRPRLPLPDCDHQNVCDCKYRHLKDRRDDTRRAEDSGAQRSIKPGSTERRRPGKRRERRQ